MPTSSIQYKSPTLFTDVNAQKFEILYDKYDATLGTHNIQHSSYDYTTNSTYLKQTLATFSNTSAFNPSPAVIADKGNGSKPPLLAAAWCNGRSIGFAVGQQAMEFNYPQLNFSSIVDLSSYMSSSFPQSNTTSNVAIAATYAVSPSKQYYIFHLVWEEPSGIKYARGVDNSTTFPPNPANIAWDGPQSYLVAANSSYKAASKCSVDMDSTLPHYPPML